MGTQEEEPGEPTLRERATDGLGNRDRKANVE
jgi:hypothetical protein